MIALWIVGITLILVGLFIDATIGLYGAISKLLGIFVIAIGVFCVGLYVLLTYDKGNKQPKNKSDKTE